MLFPNVRQPSVLLPLASIGLAVNVVLMIVVLRDIMQRHFANPTDKYLWLALVLLVWPAIVVYLVRHGFKAR
jgi:beta-lactamase regulating signal transducer with metallopeptidase domain